MSRARFAGWFFALAVLLGFGAGAAWGDTPRLRESDRFSLDVAVANVGIDQEDLRVGPGLMIAPALEYTFRVDERLRPGVYAGFGVQREGGQTTDIAGARFTTEGVTSPVAIYGLALTYDLTPRTALRFTVGGSTAFMDDMTTRTPNGTVTMEGSNLHSGIVSVGLNFALGGER